MFPAATKAGGQAVTTGPIDACKTPSPGGPVPLPYPNIGTVSNSQSTSEKVKFVGAKVCTVKSEMSRSSGDEAGTVGGVVSNRNMAEVKFKVGSSKCIVEGEKCAHLTSMTGHNGSNANAPAGAVIAPGQTKLIVAP